IGPTSRDYWSGILGFNLSHNIGVLVFALLIVVTAQYQISWLKPIPALVGGAFAVISWRCWFCVPMLGSFIGTALIVVSWVLYIAEDCWAARAAPTPGGGRAGRQPSARRPVAHR